MAKKNPSKVTLKVMSPNDVIEMKNILTARQMDALSALLAVVNSPDDEEDNLIYTIDGPMIAKLYPAVQSGEVESWRIYERIKEGAEALIDFKLQLDWGNKGITAVAVSMCKWDADTHSVTVHMSQLFKSLLVQARKLGHFSTYELAAILAIPDKYGKHLYHWLARYEDTGWRKSDFSLLMEKLGAPENMRPANFLDRCLYPAIDSINEHTNMDVKCATKKVKAPGGQRVKDIEFTIKHKENASCITEEEATAVIQEAALFSRLRQTISEELVGAKALRKAILISNSNEQRIINAYNVIRAKKSVKDFEGYFLKAIQDEYEAPKTVQNNTAISFPQRQYTDADFDALEKRKLGLSS